MNRIDMVNEGVRLMLHHRDTASAVEAILDMAEPLIRQRALSEAADEITRARRAHSEMVGPALLPTHVAFDEGALYAFDKAAVLIRAVTP